MEIEKREKRGGGGLQTSPSKGRCPSRRFVEQARRRGALRPRSGEMVKNF